MSCSTPAAAHWWPGLVLVAQPVLFFWRALIAKTAHIPYDLNSFHSPLAAAIVEALGEGRLPLWEPYAYAGYPLHADISAQMFYPPAWPAFALGLMRDDAIFYWLHWLVALQFVIAGAGAYLLLRALDCSRGAALFGATAFQLGSFYASQPQHLGAISCAAWMPFAWLAVFRLSERFTRGRFALLAASLAMAFLGGYPATTLAVYATTALLAVILAFQRRNARVLLAVGGAFAFAAALSAVQLAPTMELSGTSAASRRWMWNEPTGLPPRALVGLFRPDWLHVFTPFDPAKFKETVGFTFLYQYHGQAAAWLFLAAFFVRGAARIFAAIAAVCALVLFGGGIPGYLAVFRSLPKFVRSAAYVEFTNAAFSLALACAAALALQRFTRWRERWAVAIALATGIELLLVASGRPMNTGDGGWKRHDSPAQVMQDPALLETLRRMVHETEPPMRTDTATFSPRFTTAAALIRLPTVNGDNAFAPLRMLAYRALYTDSVPWTRQYPIKDFGSPLIDASGAGFLVHEGPPLDDAIQGLGWERVPIAKEGLLVYRNTEALPRYRLAGTARRARDAREAEELLRSTDLRDTAIVEAVGQVIGRSSRTGLEGAPNRPRDAVMSHFEPAGQVQVRNYEPGVVRLTVDSPRPATLVAAEGYAPGWKAEIDGSPQPVYPANLAFMAVAVPAGRHEVVLRYRPDWLWLWAAISVSAWAACAALAIRRSDRRPEGGS